MSNATESGASGQAGGASADGKSSDSDENSSTKSGESDGSERYKKDMLAYKDKLKAEKAKRMEAEAKIAELEKSKETDDGNNHAALAERFKKDADTWKTKAEEFQKSFIYSEKYRAVFQELKTLGFKDEATEFLEHESLDDLEVATTSKGRIEVLGAKDWAAEYKEKKKIFFDTPKSPRVNSGDGRGGKIGSGEPLTGLHLVQAEEAWKKEKDPAKKVEREKEFKGLVLQFQKQKQKKA